MKQLTPEVKHSILTHYTSPTNTQSLSTILSLHDVIVSRRSVEKWRSQWDGSIESLQHKKGAGRPSILTQREVYQYITRPIREKNRSYKQVRYTSIAENVRVKTGKMVTDRTIQLIGKKKLGAIKTKGRKRTAEECKYKYIYKICKKNTFVCDLNE
jgi:hypothetical protein